MNRFPFRWTGKQDKSPEQSPNPLTSLEEARGLHPLHKSAILGVHLGLKPGALVTLRPEEGGMKAFERFEKTLASLKVAYERVPLPKGTEPGIALYAVSKNPADAAELGHLLAERGPELDHARIGTLLGYPETATEAFVRGENLSVPERTALLSVEDAAFIHFMPSKAHWAKEVEANRPFIESIQRVAPSLYRMAVASEEERRRTPGGH